MIHVFVAPPMNKKELKSCQPNNGIDAGNENGNRAGTSGNLTSSIEY
jgi:hypothetical protein